MKKTVVAILIAVVAIASIAGAGIAYAQGANPQTPVTGDGPTTGYGMKGYRGSNAPADGQAMGPAIRGSLAGTRDGILHDGIMAYFADALNISVTDLEARLADGETLLEISGLEFDEFKAMMLEARTAAIAAAVADGTLTQEQADWMNSHSFGQMRGGPGAGNGSRGARGAGQGQFANPDCPNYVAP